MKTLRNFYFLLRIGWGVGLYEKMSFFEWIQEVWRMAKEIAERNP